MNVQLTQAAARHVASMIAKRGRGLGLRIGTRKSGCSGFAYEVDYADAIEANDQVFESHGVKLIIDRQSLPLLDGMEVDYVKANVLHEGFEFHNPQVKETCGCGESFSV